MKITQTSHLIEMDFIFVSLQITVLFVYILGFFCFSGGHCVALSSPSHCICLINRNCKCYVMNYCKYSVSFVKIHMVYAFFFKKKTNPPMDLVCSEPTPLCVL